MKKTISLSLAIILICQSVLISLPLANGQEGNSEWIDEYTFRKDLGNEKYELTNYKSPMVYFDSNIDDYAAFELIDEYASLGRYVLRNAHGTIEIYDYYSTLYDPSYTNVSIYDERYEVRQWRTQGQGRWDDLGVQAGNPSYIITENSSVISVSKTFNSWAGNFTIQYIIEQGSYLKRLMMFQTDISGQYQYQLKMSLAGITNDLVNYQGGKIRVQGEEHIISPFVNVGENPKNTVLDINLLDLGIIQGFSWQPVNLKDIWLDTHANGIKADIYIGNYTLSQGEYFIIDPTTSTFQVNNNSDDAEKDDFDQSFQTNNIHCAAGYGDINDQQNGCGMMFRAVNVPQGATINDAYLNFTASLTLADVVVNTNITGHDVDDSTTFSTVADFNNKYGNRTTAQVAWDGLAAWTLNNFYQSSNITSIIQEIIDRGGWSSGNNLTLFWHDFDARSDQVNNHLRTAYSHDGAAANAPRLVITYTSVVVVTYYLTSLFYLGISDIEVNGTSTANLTETAVNDTEVALGVANAASGYSYLYWDNENVSHIHDITVTKTMTANSTITAFAIATGGGGFAGTGYILTGVLVAFVAVIVLASRKK